MTERRFRFVRYRVAIPGFRIVPNTYPGLTPVRRRLIGVAVVVGRHAYSFQWRKP